MRFPSRVTLAQHGREVMFRFPWTMTAGVLAAGAAIVATTKSGNTPWVRLAMVGALGISLTIALTLVAEERGWSALELLHGKMLGDSVKVRAWQRKLFLGSAQ